MPLEELPESPLSPIVTETTRKNGESSRLGAKRTFLVTYAEPTTPWTARSTPGLPTYGDALEDGDPRVVTDRDAKPHDATGHVFAVEVSYEGGDITTSPLSLPDDISGGGTCESEEVFMTVEAIPRPIVNTVGDPFEPMAQRTTSSFGFTIEATAATSTSRYGRSTYGRMPSIAQRSP